MMIRRWMAIGLGVMTLLIGCGPKSTYFPLEKGRTWSYVMRYERPDGKTQEVMQIRTLGKADYADAKGASETAYVRRTSSGTDYYLSVKPDGVYRVAKRVVVQFDPVADAKPRLVMPMGKNLRIGYSWAMETQPMLIQWQGTFAEANGSVKPFDMTYQVAALDDTIDTPAGHFTHCIRIEGEGKITIYANPASGYQEVLINQREWYAPGVGLVRLERDEPLNMDIIKGGKAVMQLVDYSD